LGLGGDGKRKKWGGRSASIDNPARQKDRQADREMER